MLKLEETPCDICENVTREGWMCRSCRKPFLQIQPNSIFLFCYTCDKYGFPCSNCSINYFDGRLGKGFSKKNPTNYSKCKTIGLVQNYLLSNDYNSNKHNGEEESKEVFDGCLICEEIEDEGHVCRECRYKFMDIADVWRDDYDRFLTCVDCDERFPCSNCSDEIFEGRLGDGSLSVSELLDIINGNLTLGEDDSNSHSHDDSNYSCNYSNKDSKITPEDMESIRKTGEDLCLTQ